MGSAGGDRDGRHVHRFVGVAAVVWVDVWRLFDRTWGGNGCDRADYELFLQCVEFCWAVYEHVDEEVLLPDGGTAGSVFIRDWKLLDDFRTVHQRAVDFV